MHVATLSARELRDAFGTFPTGVTVVTGFRPDGEAVGVTANSFTSVSIDPPLVLWCIARESASTAAFRKGADFAISVLGERQKEVALRFATRGAQKFPEGVQPGPHGPAPLVPGTLCRYDCKVEDVYPGGDHLIVLGRIVALDRHGGAPILFHRGRFAFLLPDEASPEVDIWEPFRSAWF